jgi:hypothetical protein
MYYLVYLKETDGDVGILPFNELADLWDAVKELKLHHNDYAIFKGSCRKGFE